MRKQVSATKSLKIGMLVSVLLLAFFVSLYGQSSDNYQLFTSILDESSGSANSDSTKIVVSSGGQPTPIGVSESANYKAYAGYIYTLEIVCAPPPEIVEMTLLIGIEGCKYVDTLQVLPGTGTSPLHWTVIDGSLPGGLSLNNTTGEISGSPSETGTYDFTVQVTDLCGAIDTKDFSIIISNYENIKGDANTDCAIDVIDVVYVVNIILELIHPTENETWCSDCNGPVGNCDGDGEVNILDAIKIVNVILELDECP